MRSESAQCRTTFCRIRDQSSRLASPSRRRRHTSRSPGENASTNEYRTNVSTWDRLRRDPSSDATLVFISHVAGSTRRTSQTMPATRGYIQYNTELKLKLMAVSRECGVWCVVCGGSVVCGAGHSKQNVHTVVCRESTLVNVKRSRQTLAYS